MWRRLATLLVSTPEPSRQSGSCLLSAAGADQNLNQGVGEWLRVRERCLWGWGGDDEAFTQGILKCREGQPIPLYTIGKEKENSHFFAQISQF